VLKIAQISASANPKRGQTPKLPYGANLRPHGTLGLARRYRPCLRLGLPATAETDEGKSRGSHVDNAVGASARLDPGVARVLDIQEEFDVL
jgi:hypothetical protein